MIEIINKSELTNYAKSIDIALELNKKIRPIQERKRAFNKKGFELNFWNWRLTVGQIIKVTAGNSYEYNMKISSTNEYHMGQQVQAYVVLKSDLDFRKDKIKGIVDQIKNERKTNDI